MNAVLDPSLVQDDGVTDHECNIWAQQLMADVAVYLEQEEHLDQVFTSAWQSWSMIVKLVNIINLRIRRCTWDEPRTQEVRKGYSAFMALAIAHGRGIEAMAARVDKKTWEIASYDPEVLRSMIRVLSETIIDFTSVRDKKDEDTIASLLGE